MDYDTEMKLLVGEYKEVRDRETKMNLFNSVVVAVIGAGLAYWAYGTAAHASLFAFVLFGISAIANRTVSEIRQMQASSELRELGWRQKERIEDDIDAGRLRRREWTPV